MSETVMMPKLGFDMAEGTLVRWVKVEGEAIKKGDVLAEIETDKATVEVESPFTGTVLRHLVESGAVVPVSTPIAIIGDPGESVEVVTVDVSQQPVSQPEPDLQVPKVETEQAPPPIMTSEGRIAATPLAKKVAAEQRVDLSQVRGSGPQGRITRKDVEAALKVTPVVSPVAGLPIAPAIVAAPTGPDQRIPLDKLRLAIGRRLVAAKQAIPHFYETHAVNCDSMMDIRKQINASLSDDEKLSVNDFIVKAVALSLREFPTINASIDGSDLILHSHVNVGVAVAVEGGLLTVVVKDADVKPLRQISSEVREMAARVRSGKVRPEDIEGSTFSISNLGMFDVESFVAIINPPESAILAVGSVQPTPVVVDGVIGVAQVMRVTLSADHRVTDGAEAARFLQVLAKYLETPLRLVI